LNSSTWKIRTAKHHKTGHAIVLVLLLLSCTTDRTRRGYLETNARSATPPERIVIVVPGFGVTRLFDPVTRHYVWGTPRAMMHTQYEDDVDLPPEGVDRLVPQGYVGSRGPVNVGWQLTEALRKYGRYEKDATVFPFEYDWRLSARSNAARLGALIAKVSPNRKVDIVTHSAGALVALTYIKLLGGSSSVQKLVMIAPVRRGVADAFRVFVRPERFMRREFGPAIVATWPFIAELLPDDGRFVVDENGHTTSFDAWNAESWQQVLPPSSFEHFAASLQRARELRQQIASTPMPAGIDVTVIAGDCVPTARRVLSRSDGTWVFYRDELRPNESGLAEMLFEPGDGTVPVSSTKMETAPILFCDGHQGLATDPNVHRTLLRTLREQR
jgi:pimeloyl-ACP methyl ester carboxylesterase